MSRADSAPLIGVTAGDPAGVGPEVLVKAAVDPRVVRASRPIAIGPLAALSSIADAVGLEITPVASIADLAAPEGVLPVVDVPCEAARIELGTVSTEAGRVAVRSLETAVELVRAGSVAAIATAPWNKEAVGAAVGGHTGHTERLAELAGRDPASVTMMLVHGSLRVLHVSTHISLRTAVDRVTRDRVLHVVRLSHLALHQLGVSPARIAVAGLNPHAGEHGLFGIEDEREIRPAVEKATAEGIDVVGPLPGDTVFVRALRGEFDAVVAMYHDQGHVAVKVAGMGHGVNVTLGLPFLRTSVDHGTAFDIAGTGAADPESMVEAIVMASTLAARHASFDLAAAMAVDPSTP